MRNIGVKAIALEKQSIHNSQVLNNLHEFIDIHAKDNFLTLPGSEMQTRNLLLHSSAKESEKLLF